MADSTALHRGCWTRSARGAGSLDGQNGDRRNGPYFSQPSVSLYDDEAIDTLMGGNERDSYLWIGLDLFTDRETQEVIN